MVLLEKKGDTLMKLITNDPYELSKRRVLRGVTWLNQNAPGGWRRNMFDVVGEKALFRPKDCYDNECVLALAFEHIPELANESMCVTYASVSQAFRISYQKCKALGFSSDSRTGADLLDRAWEEVLREGGVTIPVRHRFVYPKARHKKTVFQKLGLVA